MLRTILRQCKRGKHCTWSAMKVFSPIPRVRFLVLNLGHVFVYAIVFGRFTNYNASLDAMSPTGIIQLQHDLLQGSVDAVTSFITSAGARGYNFVSVERCIWGQDFQRHPSWVRFLGFAFVFCCRAYYTIQHLAGDVWSNRLVEDCGLVTAIPPCLL